MKVCPYCKEEVQQEAIKCRYCHSMLLTIDPTEQSSVGSRITYVIDRGLIRFGKFSAAILAIFLVVGAYLFGFKLESALEKVRDSQEALKTNLVAMAAAQKELQTAQTTVKDLKQDVEKVLGDARRYVGEISDHNRQAIALVVSMKQLTAGQAASLTEERTKNPSQFRTMDQSDPAAKLWAVGKNLRIRFLTGDDATKKKVEKIATEWTQFANMKFDFGDHEESDIRIAVGSPDGGSWSYVGTDAVVVSNTEPTVTLGVLGGFVDDDEFRFTVLHEFGHVLGLIHETQNPNATIAWNKEVVFREYGRPPNSWPKQVIEQQFFEKSDISPAKYRSFDPLSVMWYSLPERLFTTPLQQRAASELSESDKAFIGQLYPR